MIIKKQNLNKKISFALNTVKTCFQNYCVTSVFLVCYFNRVSAANLTNVFFFSLLYSRNTTPDEKKMKLPKIKAATLVSNKTVK